MVWRVVLAQVGAGVVTLLGLAAALWWLHGPGDDMLRRSGLQILMLPGVILYIVGAGALWYGVFVLLLRALRIDDHDT